jgi:hypothetical protein
MTSSHARHLTLGAGCMILSSLAMIMAGCSHMEADIYRNLDITIRPAATYALTPTLLGARPEERDARVHNALVHQRIASSITSVLAAKGYRHSSPETADFLVYFRVGVRTAERDARGLVARYTSVNAYTGQPTPILTVTRPGKIQATDATLVIELVDRQTGAVVYRAEGLDDDVTPRDTSEWMIASAVRLLLQDL